jgi:hypothetical protein
MISTFASFSPAPISNSVSSLAESPDGDLYAATSEGLARIAPTGAVSFVTNRILDSIAIDASGQIYASWADHTNPQNPTEDVGTVSQTGALEPLI